MPNTIGKFGCTVVKFERGDALPFPPYVVIDLAEHGRLTENGAPIVSLDLMSDDEIDGYIHDLKNDLDAVGAKAKRVLKVACAAHSLRLKRPA